MVKTIVFVSHDLNSISKYCDRVFLLNKGNLLGEGSPKEMIDAYKRVLVGQYEIPEEQGENDLLSDAQIKGAASGGSAQLQAASAGGSKALGTNPDLQEYGTMQARIVDYYLTDDRGLRTLAILKGSEYTMHMTVEFTDHIPEPIFALSLKNVQGTEITGTNSMIERAFLNSAEPGQKKEITFTQRMTLQGGEYLISLGVTGYRGDTFEVYHRLYDVINVTVVSDKNTVGFYDMESTVVVRDL